MCTGVAYLTSRRRADVYRRGVPERWHGMRANAERAHNADATQDL